MTESKVFQNVPSTKIFFPENTGEIMQRYNDFTNKFMRIKDGFFSPIENGENLIPYGYQTRTERSQKALFIGGELVDYLRNIKKRHLEEFDEFQKCNPSYNSEAWREKRRNLEGKHDSEKSYLQLTIENTAVFFGTDHYWDSISRKKVINESVMNQQLEYDPSVLGFKAFFPIPPSGIDGHLLQGLLFESNPNQPIQDMSAKVADLTSEAHQHIFGTVFPLNQPGVAFETRLTKSDGIVIVNFYPLDNVYPVVDKIKPQSVLMMLPKESFRQAS